MCVFPIIHMASVADWLVFKTCVADLQQYSFIFSVVNVSSVWRKSSQQLVAVVALLCVEP